MHLLILHSLFRILCLHVTWQTTPHATLQHQTPTIALCGPFSGIVAHLSLFHLASQLIIPTLMEDTDKLSKYLFLLHLRPGQVISLGL